MSTILILFLLNLLPPNFLAKSACDYGKNSTLCLELNGCEWKNDICQGQFTPILLTWPIKYFYFDPDYNSPNSEPTGSFEDPLSTFDQIVRIQGHTGIQIIVIGEPDKPMKRVEIVKRSFVEFTLIIVPLFPKNKYILDFTGALQEIAQDQNTTKNMCALSSVQNSTVLMLFGFYLQGSPTSPNNIFICKSSGFADVLHSILPEIDTDYAFHFYKIDIGNFFFEHNEVFGSSHQILCSNMMMATFSYNTFRNITIEDSLITAQGKISFYFTSNKISEIRGKYPLSTMLKALGVRQEFSLCFLYDVQITNIKVQLIKIQNFKKTAFFSVEIYNVDFTAPSEEAIFTVKGGGADTSLQLRNFVVKNVRVRHSLFFIQQAKVTINKATFQQITKVKLINQEGDHSDQFFLDMPKGLCFLVVQGGELKIQDANFTNISSNCIGMRDSRINLVQGIFNNSRIRQASNIKSRKESPPPLTWIRIDGPSTSIDKTQVIKMSQFYFNSGFPKQGGAIRVSSSMYMEVEISSCKFYNLTASLGGAIFSSLPRAKIQIANSIFEGNAAQAGGAIHLSSASVSNAYSSYESKLINLTIKSNEASKNGGGIFIDYTNFYFDNVLIEGNLATNGGGIYMIAVKPFQQIEPVPNFVRNLTILNNVVNGLGSAMILLSNFSVIFNQWQSSFKVIGNRVLNGEKKQNEEQISYRVPTYFKINFYDIMHYQVLEQNIDPTELIQNTTMTSLSKTILTNSTFPKNFTLEVKSGHYLPQVLEIIILDQNQQQMTTINDESILFQLSQSQEEQKSDDSKFSRLISTKQNFKEGRIALLQELEFFGATNSTATLLISSVPQPNHLLKDSRKLVNFEIPILFKNCDIGDIHNPKTSICTTCGKETFTLQDPYYPQAFCGRCHDEAFCLGGATLAPKPGYYRHNTLSTNFIKCSPEEACQGGLVKGLYNPQGFCESPYQGIMCSQCEGYSAKFGGSGNCIQCNENAIYYIKFFGYLMIQIGTICFTLYMNNRRTLKFKKVQESNNQELLDKLQREVSNVVRIKIAINFFIIKGILNQYKFNLPKLLDFQFASLSQILPTAEEGFSVDCFIILVTSDYSKVFYWRLVLIALKPILIYALLFSFYYIYHRCIKKSKNLKILIKENSFLFAIVISYLLQTEIITSCLNLFKCTNYSTEDAPQYFMEQNPQIQCFTTPHIYWAIFFAIPLYLLWDIILPAYIFSKLKKVLYNPKERLKFSFLLVGIKEQHYYWELVILYRKDILIVILVFLSRISKGGQALFSLFTLMGFTYLHVHKMPYQDKRLNLLESLSLISHQVMLFSTLYFETAEINQNFSYFLAILVLSSNLIFIFAFGYFAFKSYGQQVQEAIKYVKEKRNQQFNKKSRVDRLVSSSECSSSSQSENRFNVMDEIRIQSNYDESNVNLYDEGQLDLSNSKISMHNQSLNASKFRFENSELPCLDDSSQFYGGS